MKLPLTITGTVVKGNHIGTGLNMPTANIFPDTDTSDYPNGVYFSQTLIDNVWYNSISNLGCKPTVQDSGRINLETYILDNNVDLYGKEIKVNLLEFRRDEQKFKDLAELQATVSQDFEAARDYFHIKK